MTGEQTTAGDVFCLTTCTDHGPGDPTCREVEALYRLMDEDGWASHYMCGSGSDDPDGYMCGKEWAEREGVKAIIAFVRNGFTEPTPAADSSASTVAPPTADIPLTTGDH